MKSFLCRITGLASEQLAAAGCAFLYIFCILAGYYVVKPLRDDIALLLGTETIPKLFIWTLVVMAVVNPLFSAMMNRFNRVTFIKFVYRFFSLNILAFVAAFKYMEQAGLMPEGGKAVTVTGTAFAIGVAFFLWASVFNLFAVSLFWALMADLYDSSQSKKLFGLVGAGGTIGQMAGSYLTTKLVATMGPTNLLFVTMILLEVAVWCMVFLARDYQEPTKTTESGPKPNAFSGISDIFKSKFLLGICLYLLLYTFTSSFFYFQKQNVVDQLLPNREDRVSFFADINFYISAFTLVIQLFLTGRILPLFGLTAGLSLVPVVTAIGFLYLGYFPSLLALAVVEVCRSTANYGISRPSREILFTVVSRQERYLSKSFIDTFVYRAGDALASGAFQYIMSFTTNLSVVSLIAVPIAGIYLVVAIFLGRTHAGLAKEQEVKAEARPDS